MKAAEQNGALYDSDMRRSFHRPGEVAIQAISTHLRHLTCLDLSDTRLLETGWKLRALSSLQQLRLLGLEDKYCMSSPEAAAAARKQYGLPGPLTVKDAQQWLTRPDEGW
jgi:hypothetical protein